ncbi:MAG: Sec-independent protein translocase protein TatB [Wolinella sp.]
MFGMGFAEIILIVIVAVIFLGPEKLPQAMVDIVKFFRAFKKTISDAKDSLDREINISEIKQEALAYQKSLKADANKLTQGLKLDDLSSVLEESTKEKLHTGEKKSAEDRTHTQEKPQHASIPKARGSELDFKNSTPKDEKSKESPHV